MDARTALLVACLVLSAGCLQMLGSQDPLAPDPVEGVQEEDCDRIDRGERLAAWREGVQRQGHRACIEVPREIELAWELDAVNTGDHTAAKASPVAYEGDWLVAGDTGNVLRVDGDGEVLWNASTQPSSNGIHGTPAVANGTVYVGAYDGRLYAFDADTGDERWRTKLGGSIGASPLVHEGHVYIAVETPEPSGLVSIVDATSGEEVFRDERISDHPHSSIALSLEEDVFVVGANDGLLYAWNATSWEHAWTFETGDAIKGPIAIHDGAAFFGSWDDHVYRVDLSEGEQDWRYETGANVMAGPAIHVSSGTVFVGSYDDQVYALDAGEGDLRWRAPLGDAAMSSPVVADGLILVGSYDGHMYALDGRDGTQVWSFEAGDRVTSSVAVQDARVAFTSFAGEDPGKLYVLEAAGGG